MIPRPSQEWSGDGLPPVGLDVECTFESWGYWRKGRVLYYGKQMIFMEQDGEYPDSKKFEGSMNPDGIKFRPIRTAEQIAAEEYEQEAADLAYAATGHRDRSKDCWISLAKVILDAGYRRVPAST